MKDFNFFKYFLVFRGFVNIADIKTGKINIFDMLELMKQYSIYIKGENYLKGDKNGK